MKKILNIISLLSISLLIIGNVQAQQWTIDDELKDAKIKVAYDEINIDAGKAIYDVSCKFCHKDIVAAPTNDRELPTAPNLGSQEFNKNNTDGEIFCKISYGNGVGMPGYEASISEEDRWKVVAYLRSYCESYEPPTTDDNAPVVMEKFEGKITKITATFDKEKNTISTKIEGVDSVGNKVIPNNVKMKISVKRYFGDMTICDGDKTDDNGVVSVSLDGIIADTSGYIIINAAPIDGSISIEESIKLNDGWQWVNPLDQRALWGDNAHTPLWLLISYLSVTFGVLGVIGWAAFQLFRIWMLRER